MESQEKPVRGAKLARLDTWNDERRAVAARYSAAFAGVDGVTVPVTAPGADHVFHQYVVRSERRDGLRKALGDAGIAPTAR